MMKTATQIIAAIDRSGSHNEIVRIAIDGDSGAALAAIREITTCEVDYAMTDYEGVDTMDIWGYDEDAPEGQMLWRLNIRFAETAAQ